MASSLFFNMSLTMPNGDEWEMETIIRHAQVTLLWTGITDSEDESGPIELDSDPELYSALSEAGLEADDVAKIALATVQMLNDLSECELLEVSEIMAPEQFAHDLILTSQHQGAGFWDRGYGEIGDKLTEMAQSYLSEGTLSGWWEDRNYGMRIARYAWE